MSLELEAAFDTLYAAMNRQVPDKKGTPMQQTLEPIICHRCKFKEHVPSSTHIEMIWRCGKMSAVANAKIIVTIATSGAPTKCELFEERKKYPDVGETIITKMRGFEFKGRVLAVNPVSIHIQCDGFDVQLDTNHSAYSWSPA